MFLDVLNDKFEGKLTNELLADFYKQFEVIHFDKQTYFAREGERGNKVGIVVSGVFQMFVHKENGEVFIKDFLRRTDNLVSSLVLGQVSAVNLQAVTDAVVLAIEAEELNDYMSKNEAVAHVSKACMNIKYAELYEKFELYVTKPAGERYNYFKERYPGIEEEIPQYLVASYLGITPTQLSRIQKQRYLNIKYGVKY